MSLFLKSFIAPALILGLNILTTQSVMAQASDETIEEKPPLKQYDIEIILFKNIKTPKAKEKILPTQAPLLDENFISLNTPESIEAAAELGFIIPEENEFRLLEMVKKIDESSRYKLLTHLVWRQPGLAAKDALAIQIRTGDTFDNDYSSIDNPVIPFKEIIDEPEFKTLNISKQNSQEMIEIEKVWYELEGKITITLSRYLHTHVDLVMRIPSENKIQINSPLETTEQADSEITEAIDNIPEQLSFNSLILNNFSFKEQRRMRSRKLHYLDHPELGMLILITPYEEPENIEFIEEDINLDPIS